MEESKQKRNGECSNNSDNTNMKGNGNNKGGKMKFNKKNVQCYNCWKCDHFADECLVKKDFNDDNNDEVQFAYADDIDSSGFTLMATTK